MTTRTPLTLAAITLTCIFIAGVAQAKDNRGGGGPDRKACIFQKCYDKCMARGGTRTIIPAVGCSRMCGRRCAA
jgi:hypothetical protein